LRTVNLEEVGNHIRTLRYQHPVFHNL